MKFSKLWLEEFNNFEIETTKLSEQLTMVGLEVAEIKSVSKNFHGVVVGEILEVNQHPNANKLTVCRVNIGELEPLNIVCGAVNVRPKLKVPVALIGAKLEDNIEIKKAKLRGIESEGMMCSASELGISTTSSGLLELENDAPIGENLRDYLMLDDSVVEIELTPNRGDCLSIRGIAREIEAVNRIKSNQLIASDFSLEGSGFPVTIKATEFCPHYCDRIVRNINNQICTPVWMKERLRRSDIQSVNLVVDITNYVMLELGQPLHAFDLAKLDKMIQVRYAVFGEEILLLNGKKVELNSNTLVISDDSKVLAIAGIMGGINSSVNENTVDVFLESAFFTPEKIATTSRSYSLQTDSSYRYERGVDWDLQLHALDRATSLILEISGGKASDVTEVTIQENLPQHISITLYRSSIKKILGISIVDDDVFSILLYLGMKVEALTDGWQVFVPSWRFDIKIEEDLVEEVARIYGYDRIPEQKIVSELLPPNYSSAFPRGRLHDLMVDLGYHEVITYSFTDAKLQAMLDPEHDPLQLVNPISSELGVMRTTLWPGLIKAAMYNLNRQQQRVRFFEIALRFIQDSDSLKQLSTISGVMIGTVNPEQWGFDNKKQADFFDLKNDIHIVLNLKYQGQHIEYVQKKHPALHPERSIGIYVENILIGFAGEIHPIVKQELGLNKNAYLFEINIDDVFYNQKKLFNEFSKFPKIRRDIAILLNNEISWEQIKQEIVDISGDLLQNIDLFDIYHDKSVDINKKSMAIHLDFQSTVRTLVDSEIDALVNKIIFALKQKLNATLRG